MASGTQGPDEPDTQGAGTGDAGTGDAGTADAGTADAGTGDADAEDPADLTGLVTDAQRGLRRFVEPLVNALPQGELLIPLAKDVAGAPSGERVELEGELTMTPHMLVAAEGEVFAAMFTRPEYLEPLEQQLGWETDGGPLKYCALSALAALDMALEVVDEDNVAGLVLNAGSDAELVLLRDEIASLAQGKAVPLVGYVQQIPVLEHDATLVAESEHPPPKALVAAIENCLAEIPEVTAHTLKRTFNPDRDREPHWTLLMTSLSPESDRDKIAERVIVAVDGKVPPPGYLDILFEEPSN